MNRHSGLMDTPDQSIHTKNIHTAILRFGTRVRPHRLKDILIKLGVHVYTVGVYGPFRCRVSSSFNRRVCCFVAAVQGGEKERFAQFGSLVGWFLHVYVVVHA